MNNYCKFLVIFFLLVLSFSVCHGEKDVLKDESVSKMRMVDSIMAEIKGLPDAIDEDLCGQDWASYRTHMTTLAQKIIDANTILKDQKLAYPIDLWRVYNTISANPVCGIGKRASQIFGAADVSRYSNEERMGINENDDLCLCWSIVTGREELTGYYKDGACRCTFGVNNLDPNIGIYNEE